MTDDDIRSNKEVLRDEHLKAKEVLASLYTTARRVGEVLKFYGAEVEKMPQSEQLPQFKGMRSASGVSIEGLPVDYLQRLSDEIARARMELTKFELELTRLRVEFVPFGKWP